MTSKPSASRGNIAGAAGFEPIRGRWSSALENCGVAAFPDDRLISNDDSRARLQGVVNLLPKLRVDAEARRDLLGRNVATPACHGHPSARRPARRQRALPGGRALEQPGDVVSERSAPVNLDGGAPDGIAVTIDVKRAVGGADDHRDRSA